MLSPARPDLLSVHDVAVSLAASSRSERGGVGSTRWLRDAKSLKTKVARRDLRQIFALLSFRAVPQDCAHRVHLGVARRAVAALPLHFFQDRRGSGKWQARTSILLWDQHREVAGFCER